MRIGVLSVAFGVAATGCGGPGDGSAPACGRHGGPWWHESRNGRPADRCHDRKLGGRRERWQLTSRLSSPGPDHHGRRTRTPRLRRKRHLHRDPRSRSTRRPRLRLHRHPGNGDLGRFERLWQRFGDRDDVLVLGMSGAGLFGTESEATVSAFREQTQVTFPLLMQDTTRGQLAFSDASISPYPLDVILDRTGTIRYLRREFNVEAMDTTLQQLLDE